jgi:hypothetical protein
MDRRFDPRSIVTPYAFAVHPDLLGQPLATPWQRFGAILVDLVVIAFISQIGLGPLAIASTALLFWLATRPQARDAFGKAFRIALGCLGFSIVATAALVIFLLNSETVQEAIREATRGETVTLETIPSGIEGPEADRVEAPAGEPGVLDIYRGFRGALNLQQAEDREEALTLMADFAADANNAGIPLSQIRELLRALVPSDADWASDADVILEEVMAALTESAPVTSREMVEASAQPPIGEGETEAPTALSPLAVDSIETLTRELQRAAENQEDLERALERTNEALNEERSSGFFDWVMGFIDDLGIGFGWGALYLTIAHTVWRGTSVGKRFFGIRVVMIDKRPLNWWLSFERAGGYAAGFATGLLGFAQIFWDPNRQAIHDKVSETIVIQDGKDPVPGPWMEEGKAQWSRGRKDL